MINVQSVVHVCVGFPPERGTVVVLAAVRRHDPPQRRRWTVSANPRRLWRNDGADVGRGVFRKGRNDA